MKGPAAFVDDWRRDKFRAFDLASNSSAGDVVRFDLWGSPVTVYANANFSIYSAQRCNAACRFCVEELRPASRGSELLKQRVIEPDHERYFTALMDCLDALAPLCPSISITGGEPSKDARLPRILRTIAPCRASRKTLTTNASGLFDVRDGRRVIDLICDCDLGHLNISLAHPERQENVRLMRLPSALTTEQLEQAIELAESAGVRVRLSCVMLKETVHSIPTLLSYLDFARSIGVSNVIFRRLMGTDPVTHLENEVVRYSNAQRVVLEPLLDEISADSRFTFVRQVLGYYYYVEVWKFDGMDVVFEEADLAQLEAVKRADPNTIHELVFHPDATLASTWQPWDGRLGPGRS